VDDFNDAVPPSCRFLPGWKQISGNPPTQPQCTFILDCDGTPARVAAPYHLIENTRYRVLIDHHRTSQPTFDVNWIDPSQSATALMIYQLLQKLPVETQRRHRAVPVVRPLHDTGNFRFPNTTPACLHAAGDLGSTGRRSGGSRF
jgi:phosphoesterase RecJ-like protein